MPCCFWQHTTRTFYGLQGQVDSRDSGLWINSFDYTAMQHIQPHVPEINDSVRTHCREDHPFCGYPWFLPVKFLSKSVVLHFPRRRSQPLTICVADFKETVLIMGQVHVNIFQY